MLRLRGTRLIKSMATILIPAVLLALLIIQVYRCHKTLKLRNAYLLESLSESSDWVWNALSGGAHSQHVAFEVEHNLPDRSSHRSVDGSPLMKDYANAVLHPGFPTLTVHYLWCIDGHFELGHYISVLSVIHQLQPDKFVIHYRSLPRSDPQGYWKWLEDLQRDIILLSMKPLSDPRHCRHDLSAGIGLDFDDFPDPYGVFLLGDLIITNLTRSYVLDYMLQSFSSKSSASGQQSKVSEEELVRSQLFLVSDSEPYHISQNPGRVVIPCRSMTSLTKSEDTTDIRCMNINSYVSPEELFKRNTKFYRYARYFMYGTPDPIEVDTSPTVQIPNNVHIILTEGIGEITPLVYVSIKSAFIRGKADAVYVHGPKPPSGALWNKLHNNDELYIQYIPSMSSDEIGSKHAAMIYALYTLLQHGGIAHFGDIVFMKPIPPTSRHVSALATLHFSRYRLRHRSTNTAILAGAKGSKFIEAMLVRMKQGETSFSDMRPDDIATHVGEILPASVLLDSKLTAHQKCDGGHCQVAGGHEHPQQSYTTRLIFKGKQPQTLKDLKLVEGPVKSDIQDIIDSTPSKHFQNTST